MDKYILAIDQSTSGTKAMLFDNNGALLCRSDLPHNQIIDDNGWVEHDLEEIYRNTINVVVDVVKKAGINKNQVAAVGISNQRETGAAWHRDTGKPVYNAIVWQCARGESICADLEAKGYAQTIKSNTGLHLSPYFTAAKLAWVLQNVSGAKQAAEEKKLNCGTIDSWLIYKLTNGKSFKTDFSNASRTQLLNLAGSKWDIDICQWFGLSPDMLPEICDSNALYGYTDFEGFFSTPIPIHAAIGDSHGALFGQGCLNPGMIKCTYGTGSSVMMNVGKKPLDSESGVVSSVAWAMDGKIDYVLEGNINYTGAVMQWICDDLGLISSPKEASEVAESASKEDETYLVPAFTGLGAPYWNSAARAALWNMSRHTGKAEIVRAAEECIAFQINDIVRIMAETSGVKVASLRVDGGPTRDRFLMQFQSDILDVPVMVSSIEELSGTGAAFMAGIGIGLYDLDIVSTVEHIKYDPKLTPDLREKKLLGWKNAVSAVLKNN